jgi:hypothetical protein
MKSEIVRIEAVTRADRQEMIARISQALNSAGASILDFRFFSNLALFIEAEASTARLHIVFDALAKTELQLDSRSTAKMEELSAASFGGASEGDVHTIRLFVTFVHSDPDLRIPVPAIPG